MHPTCVRSSNFAGKDELVAVGNILRIVEIFNLDLAFDSDLDRLLPSRPKIIFEGVHLKCYSNELTFMNELRVSKLYKHSSVKEHEQGRHVTLKMPRRAIIFTGRG